MNEQKLLSQKMIEALTAVRHKLVFEAVFFKGVKLEDAVFTIQNLNGIEQILNEDKLDLVKIDPYAVQKIIALVGCGFMFHPYEHSFIIVKSFNQNDPASVHIDDWHVKKAAIKTIYDTKDSFFLICQPVGVLEPLQWFELNPGNAPAKAGVILNG